MPRLPTEDDRHRPSERVALTTRAIAASNGMAETAGKFGEWRIDCAAWTITWSEGISLIFDRPRPADGIVDLDAHLACYDCDDGTRIRGRIESIVAGTLLAEKSDYHNRGRVMRPDGTIRDVIIQGLIDRDPGGKVVALHGIILDVTDLVAFETLAHHSADLLRSTLENMDQGILMIDASGHVCVHNQRARHLLGLPSEVLHDGARLADVLRYQLASGEFEQVQAHVRAWMESGGIEATAMTYERECRDGTILEVRATPLGGGGVVRTYTDVTKRRTAERTVQESERRYRLLAENTTDMIIWCALDTTRKYVSPAAKTLLGYDHEDLVGTRPLDFVHPDDVADYAKVLDDICSSRISDCVTRKRYRHRDGSWIWMEISLSQTRDHDGGPATGFVASVRDVSLRKQAEDALAHTAMHDALTGLPNRTLFHDVLASRFQSVARHQTCFAILACDLDRFKAVNDSLGHAAGDALLQTIGEQLRLVCREGDTVARLGGDEFAIILGHLDRAEDAGPIAQHVIDVVEQSIDVDGRSLNVGMSIGIAVAAIDGRDADDLLKNADIALYGAKAAGRNTYRFFEVGSDAPLVARDLLEREMCDAVEHDGFEIHYQPIIDAETRDVVGCEAVMHWSHPSRGAIPPSEFIPLAEASGQIVALGAWALRTACLEAASWPKRIRVAVNVSVVQFREPGLERCVIAALAASGLAPHRLELEITESVLMQDVEANVASLRRLKALGVRITLDAFGTGCSSLNPLRLFSFDTIKIDRTFIQQIDEPVTAAIVKAVVGVANRIGADITAEGVETERHLEQVRHEGCTTVQGSYFSQALPPAAIRPLLTSRPRQAA